MNIDEMRAAYTAACERVAAAASAVEALAADTPEERAREVYGAFEEANDEATRQRSNIERAETLAAARAAHPLPTPTPTPTPDAAVRTGTETPVYERGGDRHFLDDIRAAGGGDPEARERLARNQAQRFDELRATMGAAQLRDLSQTTGAGGDFLPPNYLAQLLIRPLRIGRPFANEIPKISLPATGNTIQIPRLATGVAVAVQASDNAAIQETDLTTDSITGTVRTIAGQQDVSQQLWDRSDPMIRDVIVEDAGRAYATLLDTQLLAGSGSSGQHAGIRGVSGALTSTYTDASPTGPEFALKVYDVAQQMMSLGANPPDLIVMHPRRAAWLAGQQTNAWPMFQIGQLDEVTGTQSNLFVNNFAGLRVITDANIATNRGAGTNEDEVYVIDTSSLMLAEGPQVISVFNEILSNTLTVRIRLYAYSMFVPNRQAKAIGIISGTGLVAPTF